MLLNGRPQLSASSDKHALLQNQRQNIKKDIHTFHFKHLFYEVLGWDRIKRPSTPLHIEHGQYVLSPFSQKCGVMVYICESDAEGSIPGYLIRRKIDTQITILTYEHMIIYMDREHKHQIWQWVERRPGDKVSSHEHHYYQGQAGESLIQKLQHLVILLEEEGSLTREKVLQRLSKAFDVDRITKQFYEAFQAEHQKFLALVKGIPAQEHREWYASVMLSRLMLVYFIQKKGFLDGDEDYLPNHLERIRQQSNGNSFYSFYHTFLLRLFHEGLGKSERSAELEREFGYVPYLNGGLFEEHPLEQTYPDIQIPDEAFEGIFQFFSKWQWSLDEREDHDDNEINPDVLGYIFEKFTNQKEIGAYYTKEDITAYIARYTIIPYLFDAIQQKYPVAFQVDSPMWKLLSLDPEKYFYASVRKGTDKSLHEEIIAGLSDVARRHNWNKFAPEDYALTTETWREAVTRREHFNEVWYKLVDGAATSINDFITYNLDISTFAQDVIRKSNDLEFIQHLYTTLIQITVLDPTCGSGAFLLAALNTLKPLYDACFERMEEIIQQHDGLNGHNYMHASRSRDILAYFREVIAQVRQHPNKDFFILKSIVMHTLYGVDIKRDVVEICRLRLFLKLMAQIDTVEDLGPLPDVDFNIHTGNSLVGFATYNEAKKSILGDIQGKMDFTYVLQRIETALQKTDDMYRHFQTLQTQRSISSALKEEAKKQLDKQLTNLNRELNHYLASEYGIDKHNIPDEIKREEKFKHWQQTHQPFNWFVEFYGIMKNGGFDVVIGNPVEPH